MQFVRQFHTTKVARAFKKAGAGNKKLSAPNKSLGEYRKFEEAAAHSIFKEAPSFDSEKVKIFEPVFGKIENPGEDEGFNKVNINDLQSSELISWPEAVEKSLHHLGSYKRNQQHELFNEHVSVVRNESCELFRNWLKPGKSTLLTGDAGVGKSTLLTQAHAAAKLQGYSLVHIGRVNKLLDGSTLTVFNEETGLWEQPMDMNRLFKKVKKANKDTETLNDTPKTLSELIETLKSPKVLLTADNFNALSQFVYSKNTNTENEPLYHNSLEIVNTLLNQLVKPSPKVCVLYATSGDYQPIDFNGYAYAPITDFDPELVNKLKKAEIVDVKRFNGVESKSFVDYLQAAHITEKPWEELYQQGNGNPRTILASATNFAY